MLPCCKLALKFTGPAASPAEWGHGGPSRAWESCREEMQESSLKRTCSVSFRRASRASL
jgi:hypothetical protein